MFNAVLGMSSLWQREIVRFYRQPSRLVGALASPLMFWLLLGSGIGTSFQSADTSARQGYFSYFFPGTLLLTLFFTAIFSTISIIEDRREGFLQGVLVSPLSRLALVLGKIFGGATLALIQGLLFLALAPLAGISLDLTICLAAAGVLLLNALLLTSLGFLIAWQFQSIQGFHAVMNLLLMPMWILSGALFPESGASPWIAAVMKWNPLRYGMDALRISLFPSASGSDRLPFSLLVTGIFTFGFIAAAALLAARNQARNLR